MSQEKVSAILNYLSSELPTGKIEPENYSELSGFRAKIHFPTGVTLLKITMEAIINKTPDELVELLKRLRVKESIPQEINKGILVTQSEVSRFEVK